MYKAGEINTTTLNSSLVEYNHVHINVGNSFDSVTNSFQPIKPGLFWFMFEVFSDYLGRIDYAMRDVTAENSTTGVTTTKTFLSLHSLNDLRCLQPASRLQMFSQYSFFVWQAEMNGMTWGGFNIDDISTNPTIAFNVMRRSGELGMHSQNTPLKFDIVLINSGQCWNDSNFIFTAPAEGVYIFSFSTSTTVSYVNIALAINANTKFKDVIKLGQMNVYGKKENTVKAISVSAVVKLQRDDTVFIQLTDLVRKDIIGRTAFKGFLYAPPNNSFVAWSATRQFPSPIDSVAIISCYVSVNIGNVLRKRGSEVIIPTDGVYYVTISAYLFQNNTFALLIDGRKHTEITSGDFALVTRERSFLLRLMAGNILALRLLTKTKTSLHLGLSFAGFTVHL